VSTFDYCGPSDLYDHGIVRGAVSNRGRVVDAISSSTDTIPLDVHGFELGDPVTLRAEAGGALPAPLAEGTTYYAIPLTESSFKLALTATGPAIDLTSAGAHVVIIAPLPVGAAISWASRVVDDMLPAHVVPLADPVPPIVRFTTAELAAWKLSSRGGSGSISLTAIVDAAQKRIARWAAGVPIRGTNVQAASNLAAAGGASLARRRSDWDRFGGI
jgi:hypothetical protein